MGASTAFHLATGGVADVVLLERETLASGSTSRSAGGARLQFADELNVGSRCAASTEFERWDALIGEHVEFVPEIAFRQVGYLFLLDTPEQVDDVPRGARGAARPRRALARADARRGRRDRAAARARRRAGGDVLPARRAHEPRGGRPGLRGGGGRARRARAAGLPRDRRSSNAAAASPACAPSAGRSRPTPSCARPGRGRARSARWPASRSPCTASRVTCGSRPSPAALRDDLPLTIDFTHRASTSTARARASSSAVARRRSRTSPSTRCGGCR